MIERRVNEDSLVYKALTSLVKTRTGAKARFEDEGLSVSVETVSKELEGLGKMMSSRHSETNPVIGPGEPSGWTVNTISFPDNLSADVKKIIQSNMKPGWYSMVWGSSGLSIVFRDRIFEVGAPTNESMKPVQDFASQNHDIDPKYLEASRLAEDMGK